MRGKDQLTWLIALLVGWTVAANGQAGLHNNGGIIHVCTSCYVHVDGSLTSSGQISLKGKIGITGDIIAEDTTGTFHNKGRLILRGSSPQHIGGSQLLVVPKLEIKNSAGVVLDNDLFVKDEIKLKNGGVNLNDHFIQLKAGAKLKDEDDDNRLFGNGIVKITEDIGSPNNANPGGLGVTISSPENLGQTTIERRQYNCLLGTGDSSFGYIYSIEPTYNNDLDAELTLCYPEVFGLTEFDEDNLILYRSLDNGLTWHQMGGFADGDDNEISLSGIDHFSTWTAGFPSTVLAVDLIAFGVVPLSNSIRVYFVTENETEIDHYEVERSADGISFTKLADVPPRAVGLNVQKVYTKRDFSAPTGSWYYRLKMVDIHGGYTYSDIAFADRISPVKVSLLSRNPMSAGESLYFSGLNEEASLCLYDVSGRTIIKNELVTFSSIQLNESLLPGIYFFQLSQDTHKLLDGQIIIK